MANTTIATILCVICGASYKATLLDGSAYLHACPPLSEPEAAAIDAGVTVAQLASTLKGATITLTPAAKALVGTPRTSATATTLTGSPVTIGVNINAG